MVAYLERCSATLARSTVSGVASELAHFGRFLAANHPDLITFADLDRRRHIEPYLSAVASAVNHRTGNPITISGQRTRIQAVGRMLDAMVEWGWEEAPDRRLIFERDSPRLPRPLPRYLPPDADRRLIDALETSPNRLRADALLLARATGMRIGELIDLELDCVHEVPGQGAWLKVPLGKLATERMVPPRQRHRRSHRPDRREPLPGQAAAPSPAPASSSSSSSPTRAGGCRPSPFARNCTAPPATPASTMSCRTSSGTPSPLRFNAAARCKP